MLGNLVEPFTPPSLDELDAQVTWTESPIRDGLALLREAKADEPAEISVDEALNMKNDSPEANRKIVSALSAMAPEDRAGVDENASATRASTMDFHSTNPILASSIAESELSDLVAFNLFGFDWKMEPFALADAVASWHTSEDRMYDKVVLRDDLVWSDGTPITAHDVAFSYQVIMSEQVPVPAVRTDVAELRWVHAYDDRTLVYFHRAAKPVNVWHLNFPVIPKHIYEKSIAEDPTLRESQYHSQLERKPVVGGPYEVVRWDRGRSLVLRRRENYFMHQGKQVRHKPYLNEVRFRILEDGALRLLAIKASEADVGELDAEQWQTQTSSNDFYRTNTKAMGPEWTYFFISWNTKTPYFEDQRVRQAMAHAMDYDEMLNDLCYGLYPRCRGIFQPDAWMFPKDPAPLYEYDLDRAEELLDEAGWVDSDGDGIRDKEVNGRVVPFEFTLMVSSKPDRIAIGNLLRQELDKIGVQCRIAPLEAAVFQERMFKKNYEAGFSGWSTGTDPFTNQNIFGTGEDRNYGSYSNAEVDRLFAEGMKEFDREKRAAIYGEIANIIYRDQPYLFLYNRSAFYGLNKKLRGYRFSPRGPFTYSPGFASIWAAEAP